MKGTVTGIDDIGSIMIDWDNGSGLNVFYGIDRLRKVMDPMTNAIQEQILAVRGSGCTNMFNVNTVQRLAYEQEFYELVLWIEEHRKEYTQFILTEETD